MTPYFKNVLATVIAAGIVALVTILFRFDERLTRIETILEAQHNVTLNTK